MGITGKYFFLLFLYSREDRDTESKNDLGGNWATYIYKKNFSKKFSRNAPPGRGQTQQKNKFFKGGGRRGTRILHYLSIVAFFGRAKKCRERTPVKLCPYPQLLIAPLTWQLSIIAASYPFQSSETCLYIVSFCNFFLQKLFCDNLVPSS